MAIFEDYNTKRELLLEKIQDLKTFEQSDKVVGLVFEISRQILNRPGDLQNVEWLLKKGSELSAYFAYLEGKANEAWAQYKIAEVAYKSVKDGLLLAIKKTEGATVTEARAEATRETAEAEVDVIAKELKAKNYATAAKACDRIVSFIQTTVKQKSIEYKNVGTAERGQ